MKKVVNISIGGVAFTIEEQAYAHLSEYLESIRAHFQPTDGQDEIIDDIELSIAEKFTAKKTPVIAESDVQTVIEAMGSVSDITDSDETNHTDPAHEPTETSGKKRAKKLYRNVDDAVLAGVASGIAAYFGVDPVFIRLLFVASVFFNGLGILAYIVLWIIMPPAESISQKLEMQGDPVTLQQFQKLLQDNMPEDMHKSTSAFVEILRIPFTLLKRIVQYAILFVTHFIPLARTLFGIGILAVSIAAGIGFSIALTVAHFSIHSGVFMLPARDFIPTSTYTLALLSLYALLLIPAILGTFVGFTILRKASKYMGVSAIVLGIVWVSALFGVGHAASKMIPAYQAHYDSIPEVSQTHDLEAFTRLAVDTSDAITIKKGPAYQLIITGKEVDVLRYLLEVQNGTLTISHADSGVCIACLVSDVAITITTPSLESISASHNAKISAQEIETDTFDIKLRNNASLEATVVAQTTRASLTHSGDLKLDGVIDDLIVDAWYNSRIDTTNLRNVRTSLELSHSSRATLGITDILTVLARYNSTVRYTGTPEVTSDVSESSSLRSRF